MTLVLLAQRSPLGPSMAPGETSPLVWAIVGVALVVALGVAWILVRTRLDPGGRRRVCRQLGRDLGLDGTHLRLLERIARHADLPDAGSLLVSEGCYEVAMRRYVRRFGSDDRLRAMRGRLFG